MDIREEKSPFYEKYAYRVSNTKDRIWHFEALIEASNAHITTAKSHFYKCDLKNLLRCVWKRATINKAEKKIITDVLLNKS